MKNIHVLATDKPSRLVIDTIENKLYYQPLLYNKTVNVLTQHIYITNDEAIKEGDWFYVKTSNIYGGNIVAKCLRFGENCWSEHILTDVTDERGYHPSHCVKIILTTDQSLDGVQVIDDEFLEWFVKNPSCEEVKIESWETKGEWNLEYKIVIPKVEPISFPFFDKEKADAITKEGQKVIRELQSSATICKHCGREKLLHNTTTSSQTEKCCTPEGQIKRYLNCIGCDRKPSQIKIL